MPSPDVPLHIRQRAARLIAQWRAGAVHARKTHRYRYLSLRVSPGWRLLSKDNGNHWQLLSHADYDKHL